MLEALDRHKRDSAPFQFTTRQLRDFIDPNHLLLKIDDSFDFGELVSPLEEKYARYSGRPAIHPEVMVRALLISSLYNITSYRRLVHAISENIAFRWFCFLGIDDKVFDHPTISVFIERIGRDGFAEVFKRFNSELLRRGMLSKQLYVDSSLVRANLALHNLYPSGLTIEQFQAKAIAENGLFVLTEEKGEGDADKAGDGNNRKLRRRYFQDSKGRVQLSPVDLDARRRHTGRPGSAYTLSYEDNIAVDGNGFILSRRLTHSSIREWKAVKGLLRELPFEPESFTADAGYSVGSLREHFDSQGIPSYIPFNPTQIRKGVVYQGLFAYHGDHLVCPQGKVLKRNPNINRNTNNYQYVALQRDCQACPIKTGCLQKNQLPRSVAVSPHYEAIARARKRNATPTYLAHKNARSHLAEGTFAHLDQLGFRRARMRGLKKVDCEAFIASLAHNLGKAVRKLAPNPLTGPVVAA